LEEKQNIIISVQYDTVGISGPTRHIE